MFATVRGSECFTRGKHQIFSPLLCQLSYPAVMAPIVRRRGVFTMQQCNCRASAALAILARQRDNHLYAPQAPHFIQFPKSACRAVVPRRFPVTIGHMKKPIFTSE